MLPLSQERGGVSDPLIGYVSCLVERTRARIGLPPEQPQLDDVAWYQARAWVIMQAAVTPRIVDSVAAGKAVRATEDVSVAFITEFEHDLDTLFESVLAGHTVMTFPDNGESEAAPVVPVSDVQPVAYSTKRRLWYCPK